MAYRLLFLSVFYNDFNLSINGMENSTIDKAMTIIKTHPKEVALNKKTG
jgi:hypothetical protein